jgi:hypothetical protein
MCLSSYLMIDLQTCQAIPRPRSAEPSSPHPAGSHSGIWESRDLGRYDHIDNQAPLTTKPLGKVCRIVSDSDLLLY